LLVRGAERAEELVGDIPEPVERERLGELGAQGRALGVLHHDQQIALEPEGGGDRRNPPGAPPAPGSGLLQTRGAPGGPRAGAAQVLERDRAAEQRIVREQDLAHAAAAQHLFHAVSPEQHAAGQTSGGTRMRIFRWRHVPPRESGARRTGHLHVQYQYTPGGSYAFPRTSARPLASPREAVAVEGRCEEGCRLAGGRGVALRRPRTPSRSPRPPATRATVCASPRCSGAAATSCSWHSSCPECTATARASTRSTSGTTWRDLSCARACSRSRCCGR